MVFVGQIDSRYCTRLSSKYTDSAKSCAPV